MVCGEEWSGVLLISNRRLPLLTESSAAPQNQVLSSISHSTTRTMGIPPPSSFLGVRVRYESESTGLDSLRSNYQNGGDLPVTFLSNDNAHTYTHEH